MIIDVHEIPHGADGIITMFVDIKDVKGNKRKDTIIFACKPVDWSSINYSDPEQAEQGDIYFQYPVSHINLTVGDP